MSSIVALGLTCVGGQLTAQEAITGAQASTQASAEAAGTRVKWRSIAGIVVPNSIVGRKNPTPSGGCNVGVNCAMGTPAPWTTLGGQAVVNLATGELTFTVHGLVVADDFNAVNLGTPTVVRKVKGTLLCNDTEPGFGELVDTEAVRLSDAGDATFTGRVDLPASCTEEPEDIVFLIRIAVVSEFEELVGMWNAFGAGRVIFHPVERGGTNRSWRGIRHS